MEVFISTVLRPAEQCIICSDHFSDQHLPVALPCRHIFGHECIKKWLRSGRSNANSCPCCRKQVHPSTKGRAFTDDSIWDALCEQSPERIHDFMTEIWHLVPKLFAEQPDGHFLVSNLLERVLIPALLRTARANNDRGPFHDTYDLIVSTWESLGRPNHATGLAVPLVRLVRLVTQTSAILPKWLTTVSRTSMLFWRANACLGTAASSTKISWAYLMEASRLANRQYFPFLHLYTVLLSQNIVHSQQAQSKLSASDIEQRCCRKIGGEEWGVRPDEAFIARAVAVYTELRKNQLDEKRLSLRGHEEEKDIVTGLWAMASWRREGGSPSDGVALRKKVSGGWGGGGE